MYHSQSPQNHIKYLPIVVILYTLHSVLDHQSRVESIHKPSQRVQGPGLRRTCTYEKRLV